MDVVVAVDERSVSIAAGGDTIGRWRRSDCVFEERGPGRYRFRAEGETLAIDVRDASGFQRALMVARGEGRSLVPPWMAMAGAGVVLATLAVAALGWAGSAGAEPPTGPPPGGVESAVVTTPHPSPPATSRRPEARDEVPPVTFTPAPRTATVLAERWNALSPATRLTLPGPGATRLGEHLVVDIGDGRIAVSGRVLPDPRKMEEVVAALGMTVAVLDPDRPPVDRRDVIEGLGLDLRGPNPDALATRLVVDAVEYALVYEPGDRLELVATVAS